jgi:hypothetical protein
MCNAHTLNQGILSLCRAGREVPADTFQATALEQICCLMAVVASAVTMKVAPATQEPSLAGLRERGWGARWGIRGACSVLSERFWTEHPLAPAPWAYGLRLLGAASARGL